MKLSRINYLQGELDQECISLEESVEIVEAFEEIPQKELSEPRENATADDMLKELRKRVSPIERRIYEWVEETFGEEEAIDPSWDIGLLAEHVNSMEVPFGAGYRKLGELLGD